MPSSPLQNIAVTVHERKRMKLAHCWRVVLSLPEDNENLAPLLSGMIGTQVRAELLGEVDVVIDPAEIVDVPQKGRRFYLELENVSERQNGIGPGLTVLVGNGCKLNLLPPGEETPPIEETIRGDVQEKTLRGLHMAFFQNRQFWDFIRNGTGGFVEIDSPESCKAAFKQMAGVTSCKELSEGYVRNVIRDFNQYINQGGRP